MSGWVDRGLGVASEATARDAGVEALHRDQYRPLVRLAGVLLGDRDAAEEVVQEAFAATYVAWERVHDPSKRASYLRSAVMNGARNRRRLQRRTVAALPLRFGGASPEDHLLMTERERLLVGELLQLPRRQRECLVLRYYLELSEREIAEALGVSAGSVKTHSHRGLRTLRGRLERGVEEGTR